MRNRSKSIAMLIIGCAVAGFAPPPPEDVSPVRIAAIVKCTKVAYTRYPDDDDTQRKGRYLAYKECMAESGETP
jgi:hypothetical protein